nr:reverse transcriptase domain-containing protein [Tanacetum cinerariifolium]
MADNRTMEELLQAPTEGYGEAIIIPEINADHFEIKTNFLQLDQENPDVSNDVIKLMMFPYSLEGSARVWYNKEPPNSILTWEDLVNKFGEMKAITTRSGVAYEGPSIPTKPSPKKDLHFDISFADALLLMPKFASTIKSLLANKDKLFELAKIPLNENCSVMHLKKLPESLEIPTNFLYHVISQEWIRSSCSPHFKEILFKDQSCFNNVYKEEITLRVNDEAVTFNLNQTTRYSSTYDDMSVNRIDIIDVTREKYAQEMLGFSNNYLGVNPISTSEPIISNSSPSLTLFEGSDFVLEEIKAYLKDESISTEIDHADCDAEGYIFLIENLLNDDPLQPPLMDLKQREVVKAKFLIEEPPDLELKDLPSHLEYAYLEGIDKLPVIIAKDLKVDEKEALLKTRKRPLSHVFKEHLLIEECLLAFAMLLGHFKDCIDAFETLKKKLTEAPILVVPDWNLPFELMCDASDFAIGAVLGQ